MKSFASKRQIIESIDHSFRFAKAPTPNEIVDDEPCDLERQEIRESFSNRQWNKLSAPMLLQHTDSLLFFTPKAWVYYVPAYMKVMLIRFREAELVVDMFVSSLARHGERYDPHLTPEQRKTIVSVLRWLSRRLDRDYWKRRDIDEVIGRLGDDAVL